MKRLIPIFLTILFTACGNKVEITNLTVEMQDGRLPNATEAERTAIFLATATPRFSWNYEAVVRDRRGANYSQKVNNVMQTSYRVIPPNTTAEVYLPTADGDHDIKLLGSGRHHFTL